MKAEPSKLAQLVVAYHKKLGQHAPESALRHVDTGDLAAMLEAAYHWCAAGAGHRYLSLVRAVASFVRKTQTRFQQRGQTANGSNRERI